MFLCMFIEHNVNFCWTCSLRQKTNTTFPLNRCRPNRKPWRCAQDVMSQWSGNNGPYLSCDVFWHPPETYRDPSVVELMLQFIFPSGLKLCINDNSQLFKRLCQTIRPWNELIYLNSRGDGVHSCMANIQINCQWKSSPPIYSPCIILIHKCIPTHVNTHPLSQNTVPVLQWSERKDLPSVKENGSFSSTQSTEIAKPNSTRDAQSMYTVNRCR